MQVTSRLTAAVHILLCIDWFQNDRQVTSRFLALSTGLNPAAIRSVMSQLKEAGMILVHQGESGIRLNVDLESITLYDVYQAVSPERDLFRFHEQPSPECPVGRNIHAALDEQLRSVQKAMEDRMKEICISEAAETIRTKIGEGY